MSPLPFLLLTTVVSLHPAKAELFSAMANVGILMNSGKEMARIIDEYVAQDEVRLKQLRQLSQEYKARTISVHIGNENTVSNPVDGYVLVKRMADSWRHAEELMQYNPAYGLIQNQTSGEVVGPATLPGDEDVKGMAIGLMRIQDVYKLNTHDLAEGRVNGIVDGHRLTAAECFKIATVAYDNHDYYHTVLWAEESLKRVAQEEKPTISDQDALEYLAFAMFKQGNLEWALHYTLELKKKNANHPRVNGNIKYYRDALNPEGYVQDPDPRVLAPPVNERPADRAIPERDVYEALCRAEIPMTPKQTKKLYCYYKQNRPFLRLAPIKVEVMHWKPKIVFFRQVISDAEIAHIKEMATPMLRRATVHNAATGRLETAAYRISKSAWLKDTDSEVVQRISDRIDMMTDLTMENAEQLQIANYGIGGHYDPHFDMSTNDDPDAFDSLRMGNRIATVLFYMSQPEAGGGTVFTTHRITVTASKYDAAFWFNVLHNGKPDLSTTHAACPVMAGTKWVANKWIHERGQENRRPCSLKADPYYDELVERRGRH